MKTPQASMFWVAATNKMTATLDQRRRRDAELPFCRRRVAAREQRADPAEAGVAEQHDDVRGRPPARRREREPVVQHARGAVAQAGQREERGVGRGEPPLDAARAGALEPLARPDEGQAARTPITRIR